jgi:catechol 2,3-dioxygenase-like lactoylglutathione lyase family enzyme
LDIPPIDISVLLAAGPVRTLVEQLPAILYIDALGGPSTGIYISPQVEALRIQFGFPGLAVSQFGFSEDGMHLPTNYTQHTVAFTGTHDNNTTNGWWHELRESAKHSGAVGDRETLAHPEAKGRRGMKIVVTSVLVDDQEKALNFYTDKLGFQKKEDISMGQYRWLTVTSPEGVAGVELVLEPMAFPPAKVFQKALYDAGIPATAFFSSDIQAEYSRLKDLGVVFRGEPTNMGPVMAVAFEDTCGNLLHLVQRNM